MRIRSAATVLALLAVLAGLALGTAAPASAKGKACWEQVLDDWLADGSLDHTYPVRCLQQAQEAVSQRPDLRDYTNISDVLDLALQNALRGGSSAGTSPGNGSGDGSNNPDGKPRHLQNVPDRSYYRRAIDNLGTTSADSLPIPLLVLGGLGTALLLSAAGLAAHKRLKRRPPAG